MSDQTPEIKVRGAWQGQTGDPARTFRGTVTHSEHPDAPVGTSCRVSYEASAQRVSPPGDHGRYVLHVGESDRPIVLTRFTSPTATSTHPHDETLEDDWDALPVLTR